MKRIILCFLLLMMAAGALADTAPVKMEVPPEAIETQAEGELETYGLTFPEDMPLAARNFVLFARAEFEKNDWTRLPKCNEYTQWYYHDKREIGWCSVFQIYCAYHSGVCSLFATNRMWMCSRATASPRWKGAWAMCASPLRNTDAGWMERKALCRSRAIW